MNERRIMMVTEEHARIESLQETVRSLQFEVNALTYHLIAASCNEHLYRSTLEWYGNAENWSWQHYADYVHSRAEIDNGTMAQYALAYPSDYGLANLTDFFAQAIAYIRTMEGINDQVRSGDIPAPAGEEWMEAARAAYAPFHQAFHDLPSLLREGDRLPMSSDEN